MHPFKYWDFLMLKNLNILEFINMKKLNDLNIRKHNVSKIFNI